jgi:hypothetical protein
LWPAVVDDVKARSRVAWMTVSHSVPVSCSDGVVTAAVADAGAVNHFRRTAYPELVAEAMLAVLHAGLKFDLVHDPGRATAAAQAAPAATPGASRAVPDGPAPDRAGSPASPAAHPRDEQPPPPAQPSAATPAPASSTPPPPPPPPAAAPVDDPLDDVADSVDAAPTLRGVALIESALGGEKIAEYEE